MKKPCLLTITGCTILLSIFSSCSKSDDPKPGDNTDFAKLETQVLEDFVNKVALPQYAMFKDRSTTLNNAVKTLIASPTEANLAAARQAWKDTRTTWEQCEGFLLGPVEDDNYDPYMDTWPVDYQQMDELLASNQPLDLESIESDSSETTLSLRGFHPLEYVLWGKGGTGTAAGITARQKEYAGSLAQDILNNTTKLYNSWLSDGGNYAANILTAGAGSQVFKTKEDALESIASVLIDICSEVGDSKMAEPFSNGQGQPDSTITESPFSHNSFIDFHNNIVGARNVYLGKYTEQGKGISDLVKAKNLSLDKDIQNQFNTAINALNSFIESNITFETAVYKNRTQVQNALDALHNLQTTLHEKLIPFVQQYVKD
ncbi:imelysin family protein [Compostibacter hankyongensis]|uniref:Imelysin family protein n=1 Tax=Compostibacter hankyongensis TaxID=1007089 RepID=A0ABP8FUJ3_9BACT